MAKGKQIKTLQDIARATEQKRALCCPTSTSYRGPIPAGFLLNSPGSVLIQLLDMGLYLYEKPKKER